MHHFVIKKKLNYATKIINVRKSIIFTQAQPCKRLIFRLFLVRLEHTKQIQKPDFPVVNTRQSKEQQGEQSN